jgi:hypothetical protein
MKAKVRNIREWHIHLADVISCLQIPIKLRWAEIFRKGSSGRHKRSLLNPGYILSECAEHPCHTLLATGLIFRNTNPAPAKRSCYILWISFDNNGTLSTLGSLISSLITGYQPIRSYPGR